MDGADYKDTFLFQSPQGMPTADIARIVVEYANYTTTIDVYSPDGLPSPSISRIIIEYADAAIQFDVQPPQGKPNPDITRIVVEYADFAVTYDTAVYTGPQVGFPMAENDTTPPTIVSMAREPFDPENPYEVPENTDVLVYVNITDDYNGVKNATLQYSLHNSSVWIDVPMTLNMTNYQNSLSVAYYVVIPGQLNCTWVNFTIIAYDYAWNSVVEEGRDPYNPYHAVPEFPPIALVSLLVIASLSVMTLKKRKRRESTMPH